MLTVIIILLVVFLLLWALWLMVFAVSPFRRKERGGEYSFPTGKEYEPFKEQMLRWARQMRELNGQEHSIISPDGTRLCAQYFEYAPNTDIELMFHGYKTNAEHDLAGGIERCFKLKRSCMLVDQRGSGLSGGDCVTFGLRESEDCLAWVEYVAEHFPGRRVILTGISMGASTVLLASDKQMPDNVVGILADCGYSSAKDIICHVLRSLHLPAKLFYPPVRLSGRLFGGFDLNSIRPIDAVRRSRLPIIFLHGEADDFVPCYMSREMYEVCGSRKKLVTFPGAGHGLSYGLDPELYLDSLREFFAE